MKKLYSHALVLALLAASATPVLAAAVGTITHLSGILTVKHPDGSVKILSVKSEVIEGDVLSTEKEAFARIKFIDNAEVVIRPNTTLKIASYVYKEAEPKADSINLEMVKGGLRAVSGLVGKRNKEAVTYGTPTATIGIRGTHLGALFCANDCGSVPTPTGKTPDNGLHVDVASGAVVVTPRLTVALPGAVGTPTPGATVPGALTPGAPKPPAGTPTPAPSPTPPPAPVVLNAGQFGYLPPPQNGIQPPLVIVPAAQAVQVRMPASISQNTPAAGTGGKGSDPECVVQ